MPAMQATTLQLTQTQTGSKGMRGLLHWNTISGFWEPIPSTYFANAGGSNPDKLDAANTNLQTLHSDITSTNAALTTANSNLVTLQAYSDGLEALITSTNTKLDTLHTDMATLTAALAPPNTSMYTTAISALGNPTIKTGSGHIYAFSATGIVEFRDNTTVLWSTVGNSSFNFAAPLIYSTSLKLFSTLGSSISLQYD